MKVVHVIIGLDVGGAENVLRKLVLERNSRTVTHEVISLTGPGTYGAELAENGVVVHSLKLKGIQNLISCFFQVRRIFKAIRPDIVHTWMYHADLIGGVAARSVGIKKVIWCIRSTHIEKGGSRSTILIRKVCARLSFFIPRIIICAAEASFEEHKKVGYDSSKMKVIPNGFDLLNLDKGKFIYSKVRSSLNIPSNHLIVGSVGRFSPVKDHFNFINAANLVLGKLPNTTFLLVGRDINADNHQLKKWISETQYSDRFVLVPETTNVASYLAVLDIFCLHSKTEGFPNVLGEAMAMGVPVVATRVGDAELLIGRSGFTVPPEDSVALAEKIIEVLSLQPAERQLLGDEMHKRITIDFSLNKANQDYIDTYLNLTNGKGGRKL